MYTIIGITGKTGGTAAKTLLAQGQKVRGIVRNGAKAAEWRERGAEIVAAELSDKAQMARALEGHQGSGQPEGRGHGLGSPQTRLSFLHRRRA